MGGVVAGGRADTDRLRGALRNRECTLSPFNAWILLKSLETLGARYAVHSRNASLLADFLAQHPAVREVNYPGVAGFAQDDLARRQHRASPQGHGGLLSFTVDGGRKAAWQFMESLELFSLSTNIGDTKSLFTHPASTTHGRMTEQVRRDAAIGENLVRLSIGLEDSQDLIADLDRALRCTVGGGRSSLIRAR